MLMETLESALSLLLDHVACGGETEQVALLDSVGRVAAAAVTSPIQVPPFDRSPLDGYAVHSEDIASASPESPVTLKVIGEADAGCGEVFRPMRGEALRIMTGAPVPRECDCVIMQERTNEGMDTVEIYAPVGHGKNICWAGEDVSLGQTVLEAGTQITCEHISVLASLGVTHLTCYRRPKVALLCTGDELKQPGEALTFGKIYDSSRSMLTLRIRQLGAECIPLMSEADDPERVARVLTEALETADLVITTGGVSVGKKDIFHQVLPLMQANRLFWKVAIKPGTPMMAGTVNGKLMICLSGNPFASRACFELLARPVIEKLCGIPAPIDRRVKTVFRGSFPKGGKQRRIVRARFDGTCARLTADNNSSGSLFAMIGANCLMDIPADHGELHDGDEVEIVLL
ncbi:MAG: molybdopterin molybdotransferase MoeA [Clostridia bacterium]|nr:molybdopterin molybdotransferase MoeA [Clostridia bacterium]